MVRERAIPRNRQTDLDCRPVRVLPLSPAARTSRADHGTTASRFAAATTRGCRPPFDAARSQRQLQWEVPLPKASAMSAVPGRSAVPAAEQRAYVHTLSLRLTGEQYRRLRRFVTTHEDRTDQRITHQAVLETALADYLERHGG